MASGLILDPRALLRTAPLVTSTCSLWFLFDQDLFLDIFLHADHRSRSNDPLPSYFGVFFRRGIVRVLGLLVLTLSTGGYNILINRQQGVDSQKSSLWYTAGTVMAASHLLFVSSIATTVQAIVEDQSNGQSTRDLERWLSVHRVRTWTVDLAAWACFAVGECLS